MPGQEHDVLRCPQEEMMWDTIITRSEIESHLLAFDRDSFREASESPCGDGLIHNALTFTSLSKESEDLLYGIVPRTTGMARRYTFVERILVFVQDSQLSPRSRSH